MPKESFVRCRTWAASLSIVGSLIACGGGGGGNEGSGDRPPPVVAPDDEVAVGITLDAPGTVAGTNRIALSWRSEGAPTSFTVYVKRTEAAEFVAVSDAVVGNDSAQFARGAAWAYDWPTARVRVRACDAQQRCADSNEQPLVDALAGGVARLEPAPLPNGSAFFGLQVSADGRTLALRTGPLSLFRRGADGRWAQDAAAPPISSGSTLALSGDGDTIASRESFGQTVSDSVVVHVRDAAGAWRQDSTLRRPAEETGAFGANLALSGDGSRMVVAAGGQVRGIKLYLYEREGAGWRLLHTIADRPDRGVGNFPLAFSADGRTLAVPAGGARIVIDPETGEADEFPIAAVHVYRQCLDGEEWELAAEFRSSKFDGTNIGESDNYASSLSLSADGKVLAVGASEDQGNADDVGDGPHGPNADGNPQAGAVYVYAEGAGREWSRQAFIKTQTAPARDSLGSVVRMRADGGAFMSSACGRAAGDEGVRRLHRADATLPSEWIEQTCDASNFYVFERQADGSWMHVAAAIVPNARQYGAPVTASADLETIASLTLLFPSYAAAVY